MEGPAPLASITDRDRVGSDSSTPPPLGISGDCKDSKTALRDRRKSSQRSDQPMRPTPTCKRVRSPSPPGRIIGGSWRDGNHKNPVRVRRRKRQRILQNPKIAVPRPSGRAAASQMLISALWPGPPRAAQLRRPHPDQLLAVFPPDMHAPAPELVVAVGIRPRRFRRRCRSGWPVHRRPDNSRTAAPLREAPPVSERARNTSPCIAPSSPPTRPAADRSHRRLQRDWFSGSIVAGASRNDIAGSSPSESRLCGPRPCRCSCCRRRRTRRPDHPRSPSAWRVSAPYVKGGRSRPVDAIVVGSQDLRAGGSRRDRHGLGVEDVSRTGDGESEYCCVISRSGARRGRAHGHRRVWFPRFPDRSRPDGRTPFPWRARRVGQVAAPGMGRTAGKQLDGHGTRGLIHTRRGDTVDHLRWLGVPPSAVSSLRDHGRGARQVRFGKRLL